MEDSVESQDFPTLLSDVIEGMSHHKWCLVPVGSLQKILSVPSIHTSHHISLTLFDYSLCYVHQHQSNKQGAGQNTSRRFAQPWTSLPLWLMRMESCPNNWRSYLSLSQRAITLTRAVWQLSSGPSILPQRSRQAWSPRLLGVWAMDKFDPR